MKSKKVCDSPEIYQIPVPNPITMVRATNAYVIRDADDDPTRALLVDTGMPSDEGLGYLQAALDELGVDGGKLDVLVTHFHDDHTGLLMNFEFGGRLYVGRKEARAWTGEAREDYLRRTGRYAHLMGEGLVEERMIVDATFASVTPPDILSHDTVLLDEGDTVKVGGFSFEVLVLPGHTPGSIALWLPENDLIISGDLVIFDVTPAIALPDEDHDYLSEYLASVRRIYEMPIDLMLPGHGISQGDPGERIEWIVAHHQRRLDRAEELIEQNPGITGNEVIAGLRWGAPRKGDSEVAKNGRRLVEVAGISYLNALVTSGRVARETGDDGLWHFTAR